MDNKIQYISRPRDANSASSEPSRSEGDADWSDALARLFEMDVAGLTDIDLPGRRFIRVNRQFCQMMRREESELLQTEFQFVLSPEGREEIGAEITAALAQHGHWQGELRHALGDGALSWVRVSLEVYQWDAEGMPLRAVAVSQDVDERVTASEKLKLSEQLLALGQQVGDVATFFRDLKTGAVRCSANWRKMMGLPEGDLELPVEVWSRVIVPEDRGRIAAIQSGAAARGDAEVHYDFRVLRPGETQVRCFEMRARYFYDDDGRPLRSIGVAIDVTDRVRAAEKLRISEEMLSLGQHVGHIATFTGDLTTGAMSFSANARRLVGLPEGDQELPAHVWLQAFHPGDRERVVAITSAALARREAEVDFEFRVRRPGETEIRHLETRARYFYDDDGRPLSSVGVAIDITERVRSAEKLRASEQMLSLGLQVGDVATFARDLRTATITCNANSRRIMGLPQGDQPLPVEVWRQAFIPEDRDRIAAIMSAAIARRDADVSYEFRVQRPGESDTRHFEMRARYSYDDDGRPLSTIGVAIDVTDRVRAAERLRISEEMLSLGQEVGRIATYIRDLRTNRVSCSAYGRRLLGVPEGDEEIPADVWSRSTVPEDLEKIQAAAQTAIARKATEFAADFRVRRPNESDLRHFQMRAHLFYDDAGQPLRSVCVAIDVTDRVLASERQRISEDLLSLGQQVGQIAAFTRDLRTNRLSCDAYGRKLLGLPQGEEEIPSEVWRRALHPDDLERNMPLVTATLARRGTELALDYRVRRPNESEWRHFEFRIRYAYDEAGKPLRATGVAIDATERVRAAEKGRVNVEIRRLAHEAGGIGTFSRDLASDEYDLPPESRVLLGIPDEQERFTVSDWQNCIPVEDRERIAKVIRDAAANGDAVLDYETRMIRPVDGVMRWIFARGRYFFDEKGRSVRVIGVFIDVTERRMAEEKLAHAAHYDALTDLPNRMLFRERLEDALARSRRGEAFALLCLDLDRFKEVNDTLGHAFGDRLLAKVAARIVGEVRETDTLSRLGGDEFAILQSRVERPACSEQLAQRLVAKVSEPYEMDGQLIHIGVSIGIAMAPADGCDHDTLMRAADMALYQAKGDGRGRYAFFDSEMNARMQSRRVLQNDLREALERGEFELFYQPVIDVASRRIVGFEALIRWRRADGKLVPPDAFIPLCEETGLIAPIGAWVIATACAEAASWAFPLSVAVNLSPMQFSTGRLEADVAAALAASGLAPSRLELEITESAVLQDTQATLETLSRLKARGIRIAMDDFGAGYSSLTHLQQFPFDRVKIDRAFTREITRSRKSYAIVKAMADLCEALEMSTTAEGVETEEQFCAVAGLGCRDMQGYLFSPPRPAKDIPGLLERFGTVASAPVVAEKQKPALSSQSRSARPKKGAPRSLSRAKLERWSRTTPAILHSINSEGRLIAVSDAWLAKFGYDLDEVLGRPVHDFLTPESMASAAVKESISEFFRTGRMENAARQMVCKDGRVLEVLISAVMDQGDAEHERCSLSVITDVTELRTAQRKLAESEADYKQIVESQTELVSLAKPDGELTFVNEAYARYFGREPSELIGTNLLNYVPQDARGKVMEALKRVCAAKLPVESESQIVKPDGQKLWVAWTNQTIVGGDGRIAGIHSVGRDIEKRVVAEERLAASEAHFRLLAENSSDMVALVRADGKRLYVSPAGQRLFGWTEEEALALTTHEVVHPEDLPRFLRSFDTDQDANTMLSYRVRRKDGAYVWVESTTRRVEMPGELPHRLLVVRDVSERVESERRLKESEARYRLLADNVTDTVVHYDRNLVRRYVSPASLDLLGYEPSELLHGKALSRCHPDELDRAAAVFRALQDGKSERETLICRRLHRDGRWIWAEMELKALRDRVSGEFDGIIGSIRDISKRKAIEDELAEATRRLEALATEDALTALANRRAFDETLDLEFRRARRECDPLALIMIDVDRFKDFNDRYGHPAGDACLRQIANQIGSAILRPGDFAARYGGEEFAVLLPNTHLAGAVEVAERIRLAVRDLKLPNASGADGIVTISAGVTAWSHGEHETGADELLKTADRALYGAKNAGRDLVFDASWLPADGFEAASKPRREVA